MRGECNCGSVIFEVQQEHLGLYQCHCSLCRKQSGTASNLATLVETSNFRWIQGESQIKRWKKSTGFNSHFCGQCGSPTPNPVANGAWQWIPAGLIDNLSAEVKAHLCLNDSREPLFCYRSQAQTPVPSAILMSRTDETRPHDHQEYEVDAAHRRLYRGMPTDLTEFVTFLTTEQSFYK